MRTMQASVTHHWAERGAALQRALHSRIRSRLACVLTIAITPFLLASCAELAEYRTDIAQLRSDLQANMQLLAQLSARVDALESRQAATESTAQHMQQELSQAVEVLLKKALVKETRQISRNPGRTPSTDGDLPERQASPLAYEAQRALSPGGKHLNLGMTQDEVRRTLGDPVSIEDAGAFIFWQYSRLNNQNYVVFDKASGQVSGWRGL